MKLLITLILLCFCPVFSIAESAKPVHVISFDDYKTGSAEDWLKGKGFELKEDAQRRKLIDLEIKNDSLVIEARRRAFGIMPNESVNVPEFTYVEIDWGIDKFPEGASYEQGVRNESIMLVIFMGDGRQSSGSMFIPDSPYFVGLYLCHGDDRIDCTRSEIKSLSQGEKRALYLLNFIFEVEDLHCVYGRI